MRTSSSAGFVLATATVLALNAASSVYLYKTLLSRHFTPTEIDLEDIEVMPTILLVNKNVIASKPVSSINPPIPELEPISQNIYLESNSGISYVSRNKTRIVVPAFAFIDEEGHVVDAEIEMQFRELRKPFEIFTSGIPIWKDSSQTLSNPLVYELRASSFGKPVYIDPENPIKIIPEKTDDSLSVFHFSNDEVWVEQSKDSSTINLLNDNIKFQPEVLSKSYAISLKCKTKMQSRREFFLGKKQTPDHFIFSIERFSSLFPEMNELTDVNWICDSNVVDNYHLLFGVGQENKFAEKITYSDSAYITKRDSSYQLHLIFNGNSHLVTMRPYIANATDELNFQLAFNSYSTALKKRWTEESPNTYTIDNLGNITSMPDNFEISCDSLGIWLMGQKAVNQFSQKANAIFIDEAGRTLDVKNGWMLTGQNSILTQNDFSNFNYNLTGNIFWTVFPDNKIGIVYPEEFRRHRKSSANNRFKMKVYEGVRVLVKNL